jgi:hypothetical protein
MARKTRLNLLQLEDRRVPATFGVAWPDPRHLTLSFAPDNTAITGGASELFQALNAIAPTADWQRDIVRAAQSWASLVNIDVALVSDNGAPFGSPPAPGPVHSFGAIRIGALPMDSTALAIAVPPDPFFADNWSGEIIFNSNATITPGQTDLYSIFLHEFGHAFGLPNSDDSTSVMFGTATAPQTGLTPGDVAAIRALYGARGHDVHDADEDNGSFDFATRLGYPDDDDDVPADGTYPLLIMGDVSASGPNADVDFYEFHNFEAQESPFDYSGPLTVRLQSGGISLLAPKLTVYRELESGGYQLLGSASSATPGDVVSVSLSQSVPGGQYFFKVEGAVPDQFGVGRYALSVTLDAKYQAQPYAGALQRIIRGPYEDLGHEDYAKLFLDPENAELNDDQGTDDDFATAFQLATASGYSPGRRFQTVASLATPTDVDVYRIRTPQQAGVVTLALTGRAVGDNGTVPALGLFNAALEPVPMTVLANSDGRVTFQATGLVPDADYYVRASASQPGATGNYELTVTAVPVTAKLTPFTQGELTAHPVVNSLVVVKNQIFHFLLSAQGPAGSSATMLLTDAGGTAVAVLTAPAGSARSSRPILLRPGIYHARFVSENASGGAVSFDLRGTVLSDPIGPVLQDPSLNPVGPLERLKRFIERDLGNRRGGFGWLEGIV